MRVVGIKAVFKKHGSAGLGWAWGCGRRLVTAQEELSVAAAVDFRSGHTRNRPLWAEEWSRLFGCQRSMKPPNQSLPMPAKCFAHQGVSIDGAGSRSDSLLCTTSENGPPVDYGRRITLGL